MVTVDPDALAAHAQHVHLLQKQLATISKHADGTAESTEWALGGLGHVISLAFGEKVGSVRDVIDALGDRADDVGRRIDHTATVFRFSEAANKQLMDTTKTKIQDPDLFHMPKSPNDFPDMELSMDIAGFATNCPQYAQAGALPVVLGAVGLLFDVIGWALDPVGNLFGEFAGLIIDLIVPLKKILDLLFGDPGGLQDASTAFQQMSQLLSETAHTFAASLSSVTAQVWDQPGASDVYRTVAGHLVQAMVTAGTGAVDLSGDVLMIGSAIGDVRSAVMGIAVDFVVEALLEAALGTGAAAATFGASLAVATGIITTQAALAVASAVAQLLGLVARLTAAGLVAQDQSQEFQRMVADIKK